MKIKRFVRNIIRECLSEETSNDKRFVVSSGEEGLFEVLVGDDVVAKTSYSIEEPSEFFEEKYVAIFKLETNEKHRGMGYAKYLLDQIFSYVKNTLKIDAILLNVYKDNTAALNLYLGSGFEVYKDVENEDPYYTLLKRL